MFCNVFKNVAIFYIITSLSPISARYQPNWESLDSRPLPSWYDESKFGIFMHWGLYSVPSFGSEWFWWRWKGEKLPSYVQFMKDNYPPDFEYQDFAPMFTAELFDPDEWADILSASGARYLVLTSKHHEGWTNWGSKYSWNWNSVDAGPHRDLVGDLAKSVRNKTDIHFGLYHSLFEWFHPLFLQDKQNKFKTQLYVQDVLTPMLHEIVNSYQPDVLWADGPEGGTDVYWNSTNFLAWLYNDSPVKDKVVTNDRWGSNTKCKHGGYWTCHDRYNPGVLQKHKWENCMTIDTGSWGYRRNVQLSNYLDMEELTELMAETVSCGGNLLMNVGPTHDGRIIPLFEERLRQMGSWLKVNGEAIYSSKPWTHQNDTKTSRIWYTSKPTNASTAVYAIVLDWPTSNHVFLGAPVTTETTKVEMLGYSKPLSWKPSSPAGINITMPTITIDELPCQWAWVLKLLNVK
ncbi:alpha-L-fucosidase-like [Ptychodera flava]|uniref:alpha-L-fucosidase-like n=1 Tax=Ptychodera flava TaxID=63121 RepID=UPI00396A7D25